MPVYITTNKDINHNILLTESATCLFREDIVVLIDIDGETANEVSYLMNISEKKKFQLYTVSLLDDSLKDCDNGQSEKCYDILIQAADNYLDRNGSRRLIVVGYTLVPVLLKAYKTLKQKNVQPEARMICFFSDRKNSLTERNKMEEVYRNNKPQTVYVLESKKWEKKNEENLNSMATDSSKPESKMQETTNSSRNKKKP